MNLSKLEEIVKDRESWHAAVRGVAQSWIWLSDWKTTKQVDKYWIPREHAVQTANASVVQLFHTGPE